MVRRLRIEFERFIRVRGIAAHALVLENEITQAVADRPGLVQLDAPGDVWTRAEEGVRPGVDARMGERLEEASRRVEGAIRVVRVNAHEHEPRVSPRDLNGLGQPLDVGGRRFAQEI
jgi:hypothetical protein